MLVPCFFQRLCRDFAHPSNRQGRRGCGLQGKTGTQRRARERHHRPHTFPKGTSVWLWVEKKTGKGDRTNEPRDPKAEHRRDTNGLF